MLPKIAFNVIKSALIWFFLIALFVRLMFAPESYERAGNKLYIIIRAHLFYRQLVERRAHFHFLSPTLTVLQLYSSLCRARVENHAMAKSDISLKAHHSSELKASTSHATNKYEKFDMGTEFIFCLSRNFSQRCWASSSASPTSVG